jgi:hypothetical protein
MTIATTAIMIHVDFELRVFSAMSFVPLDAVRPFQQA